MGKSRTHFLAALLVAVAGAASLGTVSGPLVGQLLPETEGSNATVIDDGDIGFATQGKYWRPVVGSGGYLNDYMVNDHCDSRGRVRWQFSPVLPGLYEVYATWPANDDYSKDVTFRVYDRNGQLGADQHVDQRKQPDGSVVGGSRWQSLGKYSVEQLYNDKEKPIANFIRIYGDSVACNRVFAADAVRVVRIDEKTRTLKITEAGGPDYREDHNVVRGQKNVQFFQFQAEGDDIGPLVIDRIYLAPTVGSAKNFSNLHVISYSGPDKNVRKEYTYKANILNDGRVAIVIRQNGIRVEKNERVAIMIEADISEKAEFGTNEFAFATAMANYIYAKDEKNTYLFGTRTDGQCKEVPCEKEVWTGGTINVKIGDENGEDGDVGTDDVGSSSTGTDDAGGDDGSSSSNSDASASLVVAQQAISSEETAVENQKNLTLLRFKARASGKDTLMTKSKFKMKDGNVLNLQNYALWTDTDGNGQVDTLIGDANPANEMVAFSNIKGGGYVVPKDTTVTFEVRGDVASSPVNGMARLEFATTESDYVAAEELSDGKGLSGIQTDSSECPGDKCDINVTTANSTLWHIGKQGSLYVTKDSVPLRNRQLLGGTLGDAVLRIQFHAEDEDIDVTDLQITSSGGFANSVDRLELYKEGSAEPFALATISGCASDATPERLFGLNVRSFCANMESEQLVIPEGSDVDVIVRPRMKTDTAGAVTNETIAFWISGADVADNSSGAGAVRARGRSSQNILKANNGDSSAGGEIFIGTASNSSNRSILGNRNVSVLAKIASLTNANPDPNGTSVPTGDAAIGQFKFTAASHTNSNNGLNDAVINRLYFDVTATNVAIQASSFILYNKADSSTVVACIPRSTNGTKLTGSVTGTFLVECSGLFESPVGTNVSSGDSVTLVLESYIQNPNTSAGGTSTLQVALKNINNIQNDGFGPTSGRIEWHDYDGGNMHSFYWIENPETNVNSTAYSS